MRERESAIDRERERKKETHSDPGTNVLVLGKQRDNLLSPSNLLKRTSRKMSL